ncbi:hypothetical protein Kfla_0745 [Kribbella flavida DSM 17836]|uniref:Type VII secretion protein EccE n=1 Tax=Kribbella flavida (strain DSM 17836 / JCM 10339 / NBRC 14399) TaxID=479435 RepID=D2PYL8_KRIFD|nr:hypothetical protein [Kribbella flavida]ADB29864.1 hypothetical protein Kfla_0745 [Kribbella flavida DSM 17836]
MRPSAAAAAAPGQPAAYASTAPAVPQATTIGTPVTRTAAVQQRPTARPNVVKTASVAPAATRSYLVEQPPRSAPPVPDKVRLPEREIRVGQVVCWQLVVVAVAAATAGSRLTLVLTSLGAITLVLLTAVRVRGLWLYRWVGVLLGFLARRRRADLGNDTALNLVSLLCGQTTTDTLVIREQPYGVLSHPRGVSVVLRVGTDAQQALLPQLTDLTASADEQPVGVAVQLVLHTGLKQSRQSRAWIAVSADRSPELPTDEQVRQVLANASRRLVRRFDREQVEYLPLDEPDALASIGALAHTNAGRGQLRERWSCWTAGPVLQVTLRLSGFAAINRPAAQALVDTLLGTATGCAHTLAITVTAPADGPEPTQHDAVLRVAASHPATLDAAVTVLTTLARSYGVVPERLDGRHATGVAATLPLGVPLS